MKLRVIVALAFFTAASAFAQANPKVQEIVSLPVQNIVDVQTDNEIICVLRSERLDCSGESFLFTPPRTVTNLKNARQLSISSSHLCLIDDDGLKCYSSVKDKLYEAYEELAKVPAYLENVKHVSVSYNKTCVIDAHGAHCWGIVGKRIMLSENSFTERPVFIPVMHEDELTDLYLSVETITADFQIAYVIDSNKELKILAPVGQSASFQNVNLFYNNGLYQCAVLADQGLVCEYGEFEKPVRPSNAPVGLMFPEILSGGQNWSLANGYSYMCGVEKGNVQCWKHPWSRHSTDHVVKVPAGLSAVTHLSATKSFACAYNGADLVCWGDKDSGIPQVKELIARLN